MPGLSASERAARIVLEWGWGKSIEDLAEMIRADGVQYAHEQMRPVGERPAGHMLGEPGTEQFTTTYKLDGRIIDEARIHDPFIYRKVTVKVSWLECLKGLLFGGRRVDVEVSVRGSKAAQRRILLLDPVEMQRENEWEAEQRSERPGGWHNSANYSKGLP